MHQLANQGLSLADLSHQQNRGLKTHTEHEKAALRLWPPCLDHTLHTGFTRLMICASFIPAPSAGQPQFSQISWLHRIKIFLMISVRCQLSGYPMYLGGFTVPLHATLLRSSTSEAPGCIRGEPGQALSNSHSLVHDHGTEEKYVEVDILCVQGITKHFYLNFSSVHSLFQFCFTVSLSRTWSSRLHFSTTPCSLAKAQSCSGLLPYVSLRWFVCQPFQRWTHFPPLASSIPCAVRTSFRILLLGVFFLLPKFLLRLSSVFNSRRLSARSALVPLSTLF